MHKFGAKTSEMDSKLTLLFFSRNMVFPLLKALIYVKLGDIRAKWHLSNFTYSFCPSFSSYFEKIEDRNCWNFCVCIDFLRRSMPKIILLFSTNLLIRVCVFRRKMGNPNFCKVLHIIVVDTRASGTALWVWICLSQSEISELACQVHFSIFTWS